MKVFSIIAFIILSVGLSLTASAQNNSFRQAFISNEGVINGLKEQIDIENPVDVFGFVFSSLQDEIMIYPSENYYYYIFNVSGKTFWSSFCLSADKRDKGILSFGYIEKSNDFNGDDPEASGGSKDFSPADGMVIKKINPFRYSVTYNGRTVFMNLKRLNLDLPSKMRLMDEEHLIGPNFDESGLQFFLVFNKKTEHFYWILNEEEYVPESFDTDSSGVLFGRRTGFVFFQDSLNSRKILVGADAYNVLKNNWYDGPFDQLPDNYVNIGEVEIQRYIESAYPADSGKIDKYGNFLEQEGVRVAIAPYYAYYSRDELLGYINDCIRDNKDLSELFTCLTQQIFYIK